METRILFAEHQQSLGKRIDRAFAWLMVIQWILAIIIAIKVSTTSQFDVWITVFLGGVISSFPLYFAIYKPGNKVGRYTIAIAQMCFSALFIRLLGSSSEARSHIFGSLAFIAAYRDWRVLTAASALILFDHYILSIYLSHSNFGMETGAQWGWLIFEDIVLGFACVQATKEMHQIADSNLKIMKTQLDAENLNIRRTQFFSVISHEIRTPLNGIIGFSDLLKVSPNPQEQREYVDIIKECSDALLKLINDLLDFSKIDSGHLEIDSHPFKTQDLRKYFENVFLLECQKKNLEFSFEIANEVPNKLIGDSHRIRQVLSNLVSNAIKFTETGSVRVRLSKIPNEKDIYRWDVKDTGIGIKNEYIPNIFSPYTQEYSSTARKYGGSGLGLSISKNLVELMGGEIMVESRLGKGTHFSFAIPLKQAELEVFQKTP